MYINSSNCLYKLCHLYKGICRYIKMKHVKNFPISIYSYVDIGGKRSTSSSGHQRRADLMEDLVEVVKLIKYTRKNGSMEGNSKITDSNIFEQLL